MSDPPFEVGAAQVTKTCPSSAVAPTELGAPGLVNGIAEMLVLDTPVPAALIATTVTL
jgi:hypothetical protein